MRFRPANIRLINRRSNLPRLLLALSSINGKSNNKKQYHECAGVDRSLHIRAFAITNQGQPPSNEKNARFL